MKTKIAIVGVGQWGRNLLREFSKIASMVTCCHQGNLETRRWLKANYPTVKITTDYNAPLRDRTIDALVIATPIDTHFELAYRALQAGKHVFIEKPITETVTQAKKLVTLARQKKRILFVGHTFVYHPVLQKLKELTKKEKVQYLHFIWHKFGTFEENILWNLACHDISIAIELLGTPQEIRLLHSRGIISKADIVTLLLKYRALKRAVVHLNRASLHKTKSVLVLTNRNIFVWHDNSLYKLDTRKRTFGLLFQSREEALSTECRNFISCIQRNKSPYTDGEYGLRVVRLLNAIRPTVPL